MTAVRSGPPKHECADTFSQLRSAPNDVAPSERRGPWLHGSNSIDDRSARVPSAETMPLDVSFGEAPIRIIVESSNDIRLVQLEGELDVFSRELVARSCAEGEARVVIVDLSRLTFLDCGGYGALVAARTILARDHRTLALVGAVGEPRRLLDLIDLIERRETMTLCGMAGS